MGFAYSVGVKKLGIDEELTSQDMEGINLGGLVDDAELIVKKVDLDPMKRIALPRRACPHGGGPQAAQSA